MRPDYRAVFESSPGHCLVLAADPPRFTIEAVSEAYLDATRMRREDLVGCGLFEVLSGNRDESASAIRALRASLERVVREGAAHAMIAQRFEVARPADQGGGVEEHRWSPLHTPVRGADGTVTHVIHQVEDAAGRLLVEAARRAVEVRDDVLGIVAHDLRSPLQQIVLEAEWLQRNGADASAVQDAAMRMNRLIQDLLDVARIEAGTLAIARAPIDADALLRGVVEMHRGLAAAAGLTLRADLEPALPAIAADRCRLVQVLENVLGNAIKFTPSGGTVTLAAGAAAGGLAIRIADTGEGIPADDLPHVFERYWQGRRGERRGAGLGLAIVAAIVAAHDGTIAVESTPGRGTTFCITLPAVAAPARPGLRGVHVLVVDDDVGAAAALAALLEDEGCVVATATRGAEALATLDAFPAEVALVDVVMPGMTGAELVERVRAARPTLPCVFMTGYDDRSPLLRGADVPRVVKPIDLDRLLAVVAAVRAEPTPRTPSPR